MTASTWTPADDAELDVLTYELVRSFWDHRDRGCEACDPEPCPAVVSYLDHRQGCWRCANSIRFATAYWGDPCPRYLAHLEHGKTCKRCNPCPRLRAAIATVLDWREARTLLSRAEALRTEQTLARVDAAGTIGAHP